MKRLDVIRAAVEEELGTMPVRIVGETELERITGQRLGNAPYKVIRENGVVVLGIKYRSRPDKTVKRFIYQGIAEAIFKSLSYGEMRWIGLVMATPLEMPPGVKPYQEGYTRSKALSYLTRQAKRIQEKADV